MEQELLLHILNELKRLTNPSRLWRIEDVVDYFQMSRSTVTRKIITEPDFPKPISINDTQPRWQPEEVKNWANRKRT